MIRTRLASALAMAALAAILSPSILHAQITFERTYGGPQDDGGYSVQQTADGGYIAVGHTDPTGAGRYDIYLVKTDSAGEVLWTQTYGGVSDDQGYCVQQTTDGGYIIAGYTASFGAGFDDVYLIKTNANGETLWTRTFGGTNTDVGYSVQQTVDGGYVIAGYTMSYGAGYVDIYLIRTDIRGDTLWTKTFGGDGDDFGESVQQANDSGFVIAGLTNSFGAGSYDVYVVKTDNRGDTLWTKTYGGAGSDFGSSVLPTEDSSYVIAGSTMSFGAGGEDVYLIKTDSHGDTLWTRTIGGDTFDRGNSVAQTADHGFVLCGQTASFGAGNYDAWLIKIDSTGDALWTRTYGGTDYDQGWSVQQTADGGYTVVGVTTSFGAGRMDVYLIKTNVNGDTMWTRTFGDTNTDVGYSVQQASDSGYIIAGHTFSFGAGRADVYLIKTDENGDTMWTRSWGGDSNDLARTVQQTTDGGYIVVGLTTSFGAGREDVYLIKTDANGDTMWTRTFGGAYTDGGCSVQQTVAGGYIVAGYTESFGAGNGDVYLVETDAVGNPLWTRTYGGNGEDCGYSVQQTADSGYVIAGYTASFGAGGQDVYLIRTNAGGDALWTKTFGGSGSDEGFSAQQTTDGGYVIVGFTTSSGAGGADVYLIKTDTLGNVAVAEPTASPTRAPAITLSCEPNPFAGTTTVRLSPSALRHSPLTLRMYDSQGRVVLSREVSTSSFPLSTSDLPSGAYFIRCDASGEHATTRIVLQR